jgi:hypothetical protein
MSADPLSSPYRLAVFLIGMGYSPAECLSTVASEFPEVDWREEYKRAAAHKARSEAELEVLVWLEAQAAVGAEHDLREFCHGRSSAPASAR